MPCCSCFGIFKSRSEESYRLLPEVAPIARSGRVIVYAPSHSISEESVIIQTVGCTEYKDWTRDVRWNLFTCMRKLSLVAAKNAWHFMAVGRRSKEGKFLYEAVFSKEEPKIISLIATALFGGVKVSVTRQGEIMRSYREKLAGVKAEDISMVVLGESVSYEDQPLIQSREDMGVEIRVPHSPMSSYHVVLVSSVSSFLDLSEDLFIKIEWLSQRILLCFENAKSGMVPMMFFEPNGNKHVLAVEVSRTLPGRASMEEQLRKSAVDKDVLTSILDG